MPEKTLLDYAEAAGLENLRNHLSASDSLSKESNTTLTILLAGAAGSFGYSIKVFDGAGLNETVIGLASVSFYLFGLSSSLVWRCMKVADMPSPTNEPMNIFQDNFTLEQIREAELKNIQARIRDAVARNGVTAYWLNRVRLEASATPIIFVLAILSSWAGLPS
jgi:hypothetical protein